MSDEATRLILDRHRQWLESAGALGERAVLPGTSLADLDLAGARLAKADLRGCNFGGADLSGADLSAADLEGADLSSANLECADLSDANLRRARLTGCRLRGVEGLGRAHLRDADLSDATGLTGVEFAGADLIGARLPHALSFDGRLAYVATASQNARPAFLSILVSCVFVGLTVFSTPDAALVSNRALALLPDLSTNIPAASFFYVAPVLLLCLYAYLHLQMSGIGETLAELPTVFPDGTPLIKRAYPWVASNLLRLKAGWRRVRIEELTVMALLWGAVPATLIAIWLRYLPLRDWWVSGLHVALIAAGAWGALRLFRQTVAAMSGRVVRDRYGDACLCGLVLALIAATLGVGLYPFAVGLNPRRAPAIVLDMRDADLSHTVLRRKDLRYASAGKSKLTGADLRDADLAHADFQRADFAGADMESAALTGTDLDAADFRSTCLRKVSLKDADMEDADFRGSYLGLADLRSPFLTRANFADARLHGADLRGAKLTGADFERAVLRCFALHKKDTPEIICPDLTGADLQGARLRAADLRYARGLTGEQLAQACGDEATALPDGLSVPVCEDGPAPEAKEPPTDQPNPCAHEMRDDQWPR